MLVKHVAPRTLQALAALAILTGCSATFHLAGVVTGGFAPPASPPSLARTDDRAVDSDGYEAQAAGRIFQLYRAFAIVSRR